VTYVKSSYVRIHYNSENKLAEALGGDTQVAAYAHMEREAELVWRAHNAYGEKTDLKNITSLLEYKLSKYRKGQINFEE
jgi:hypothetical protein